MERHGPQKGFVDVFNLVNDRRTLELAWQRLSRNRGSSTPGTDGVTRQSVERQQGGVARFLDDIQQELRSGTFKPEPVRQRLIPKAGKPGQFRPLGIPTLKDRLVQMALKLVLEPIFEADFYPTSFGFRRGRNTHDAIAMIQRQINPNAHGDSRFTFVIEGDIKGCFDNIDHHLLMERVRRRIGDRKVLHLVFAFIKAGIMAEGNVRHPVAGTPQGGIISPLLANIFLTGIDERYQRWTPAPRIPPKRAVAARNRDQRAGKPTFYIVRYADDFVVLTTGSRQEAEAEREALALFLRKELRLELSKEKTLVTAAEDGFAFVGFRLKKDRTRARRMVCKLYIPRDRLQNLRRKIKGLTDRSTTGLAARRLIRELNALITGWRNYYRFVMGAYREFKKLDWWLWRRLLGWMHKKHPKTPSRVLADRFLTKRRGAARRWTDGGAILRQFAEGGTGPYPFRGIRITNGWDASPDKWFRPVPGDFRETMNTLWTM
jgi:group II intron reverse transcriptase/maturase